MNLKEVSAGVSALLLVSFLLSAVEGSGGDIRQRSDGCGRNPLITLAAAFGSGSMNLNDVLRMVKADPAVWSDMRDLLRRYDDCIRAGDGLHFKRSSHLGLLVSPAESSRGQSSSPYSAAFMEIPPAAGALLDRRK